jgi:hypothetical protein
MALPQRARMRIRHPPHQRGPKRRQHGSILTQEVPQASSRSQDLGLRYDLLVCFTAIHLNPD